MQKVTQFIRNYPLSLLCLALIWYLSLFIVLPETPLDDVAFIDKWTHLVMYGGTTSVIWWEYLRSHHSLHIARLALMGGVAMVLMGGLVELVQAYCTTTRSGEWLDFVADSMGVLGGWCVGWMTNTYWFKRPVNW